MQKISGFKGIKIGNVPTYNLRVHFYNHYHMVKSSDFNQQIKNWGRGIRTPYLIWGYYPENLFTFLTQLSIIDIESYLSVAVYHELGMREKLKENLNYIKNPFSIPGEGGTVNKYYKLLPRLVNDNITLPISNKALWEEVKLFYKEVRNPLFHGKQLNTTEPDDLIIIFELLADIYGWIDSWHDINNIIPDSEWVTKLERN